MQLGYLRKLIGGLADTADVRIAFFDDNGRHETAATVASIEIQVGDGQQVVYLNAGDNQDTEKNGSRVVNGVTTIAVTKPGTGFGIIGGVRVPPLKEPN
jgi:hypothetical protein